jgi:hypothetical protein
MSDELQLVVSAHTRKLQLYLTPKYCHRIARQAEARRTLVRSFAGSETCPEKQDLENLLHRGHRDCSNASRRTARQIQAG